MNNNIPCSHLTITAVKIGGGDVCEECIQQGSQWVNLHTCQTCGITLCCDDSPHAHMTQHFEKSRHPLIASAQPGERWLWCYADQQFSEY